jgi:hypothetical protein
MSDLSNEFINKVFEDAQNDSSLLDTVDIDEIISMSENENMDYINEKTMNDILNEIYEALKDLNINETQQNNLYSKLAGYRFIENVYELHKGKHIRWIRFNNPEKITNGAIVAEIKFRDNGTHVLCKTIQNKIFQIKYDDCLIFQKLTTGEQLILMAYEYAISKNV